MNTTANILSLRSKYSHLKREVSCLKSSITEHNKTIIDVTTMGVEPLENIDTIISSIITYNPDSILYFPRKDVPYLLNLVTDKDVSITAEHGTIIHGKIHTTGNLELKNLEITHNTESPILGTLNVLIENCRIVAPYIDASIGHNRATYRDTEFFTTEVSIGTKCWSKDAKFYNCRFLGEVGADVQDSEFYYCHFEASWGVHMPFGEFDDSGADTGYTGTAKFYSCYINGTSVYGMGLGNKARPSVFSSTVLGYNQAIFVRTASTISIYDSFISPTRNTGVSAALKFVKYRQPSHPATATYEGDSILSGCTLVSGTNSIQIPNLDNVGSLEILSTDLDFRKILVEDSTGQAVNPNFAFKYIVNEVVDEAYSVEMDSGLLEPRYNSSNLTFINIKGTSDLVEVNLTKWLLKPTKYYPSGYTLLLRGDSSTHRAKIKSGYNAAEGTLVQLKSGDTILGSNQVMVLVYVQNIWKEL